MSRLATPDAGDNFGSTGALSVSGNTLAVGVPNDAGSSRGINKDGTSRNMFYSGVVYLY
ncbi:MAG: hypothetical protein PVI90_15875 [Desulfobacteraceae bacterium]|jgi:hypothetical protein